MKLTKSGMIVMLVVLTPLAGCRKNPKLGTLALDVYLHPEAGSSDDTLLETAIRKNLSADQLTAQGVYVRVLNREVVLTGEAASAEAQQKAGEIAAATKVTVNDQTITPQHVTNLIKAKQQQK
jgi:hypothetical protein